LIKPLILASKSPRRRELLSKMGLKFRIESIEVDESYPTDLDVKAVPKYLAERKAIARKQLLNEEILIAADTLVILENQILGKPENEEDARLLLSKLSGKTHKVVTGVCLLSKEKMVSFQDTTEVTFKDLSPQEIDYYIKEYQPYDKAGAYGIQEWIGLIGVTKLKGSYYNVVGLPVQKVYQALINF